MTDSANISVVILTYDEELNVRSALESVRWCDNVVVVDSFSKDRTEEICRAYSNVTFLQHAFENFAAQRQYGLESGYVRHDWVLALDADEQVPAALRDELIAIAAADDPGGPVAYDIAMRIHMWGKWLKYSSEYPVYWRRFFRAGEARFVQEGHADKLCVTGRVERTCHDLIHLDRRGISDWLEKHNGYSTREAHFALDELQSVPLRGLMARDRAVRRKSLKRIFRFLPFSGAIRFTYLFFFRLGFLDGWRGFRYARLKGQQAYFVSLKIQELRDQQRAMTGLRDEPATSKARELVESRG